MNYISFEGGRVKLAGEGKIPGIYVESKEKAVIRAAQDLCRDIETAAGVTPLMTTREKADIVIRTGNITGWERYLLAVEGKQLVISGADVRGTIYGIYDLSENIGISPWYWWADVVTERHDSIYVTIDEPYDSGEPDVKYRGIFINDEENLTKWAYAKGDLEFVELYKRTYELLLRLKGNILWPAMHSVSPHFHKNPINAANAELYGIIIGTSHCEQMMRNNISEYFPFERKWEKKHCDKPLYKAALSDSHGKPCAYIYVDKNPVTGERVYNKELIQDYWRESVQQFGCYENMYTMGMRGLHDSPWQPAEADTPEEKAKILEEVIADQRKILEECTGKAASSIPQIFVPYKEILEIYNSGLELPDDITLMWTDDNYGYLRQLPAKEERSRTGGAGIYYHLAYRGCPTSYIWFSTTPFALMREELTKGYYQGIDKVWIAYVGDIKAAEQQLEYFLSLAWDVEKHQDIHTYAREKAMRDFGMSKSCGEAFADWQLRFQTLAFAVKPEFFVQGLFQLKDFGDEGQAYLQAYDKVLENCEQIYAGLHEEKKIAFFEMYLYALRCCRNTARQYIIMDEQNRHIADGYKNAAEDYIYDSDNAYYSIIEDTKKYYAIHNGKWKFVMDSCYGYFVKREHSYPLLPCHKEWGDEGIGAATERMLLCGHKKNRRFIDIYNHYSGYAKWKLTTACTRLIPDKTEGTVITDQRIYITADYDNAPREVIEANVFLSSDIGDSIKIPVTIDNTCADLPEELPVEEGGYLSVMACNYSSNLPGRHMNWVKEEFLGRCKDSVRVREKEQGASDAGIEDKADNAAVLEYDVYFTSQGEFEMDIYRIPTLNERGRVRFAVAVGNEEPVVVECNNKYADFSDGTDSWGRSVLRNSELLTVKVRVKEPGRNTIRIYSVDADVILEKLVVWTEERIPSYFGPEESVSEDEEGL